MKTVVLGLELFGFGHTNGQQIIELEQRVRGEAWFTLKDLARHKFNIDAIYDSIYTIYANLLGNPRTHSVDGLYTGYIPSEITKPPLKPVNVDLADSAFAAFRRMCIVAKEKGIDLQMFLSPLHHNFVLKEEQRSAWLQRLNTIAQQCGFRIRRFSEAELNLRSDGTFLDATHFHPNTGDRILRALFAVNRGASRSGSER